MRDLIGDRAGPFRLFEIAADDGGGSNEGWLDFKPGGGVVVSGRPVTRSRLEGVSPTPVPMVKGDF